MNIYPAIDIKSGACVRLYQGCYDQVTIYANDPIKVAQQYARDGAKLLHIVDLDGAKEGITINADLIANIVSSCDVQIQYGGGIRTRQQILTMLNKGVQRIVLGSVAILQPNEVKNWLAEFGPDRIAVALDVRLDAENQPILAINGWQKESGKTLWELLDDYRSSLLKHVLCTDIIRDGSLCGVNVNLYKECVTRYPELAFQASGGVSTLEDLRALSTLKVSGVVIGKAFYEEKFSLPAALQEVASC